MAPATRIRIWGENPCVSGDATGDKCFQVWQWLSCWAARLGFVNRKSDVVWGERAASGWEPVSADACPRVSDLPDLMREDAELAAAGRKSALRVFVQYWNNTTAEGREAMLDVDLRADAMEVDDMASAAAVIHGLCVKDGLAVPLWVHGRKATSPQTLSGVPADSSWGEYVKSHSSEVCWEHDVFFEESYLLKV